MTTARQRFLRLLRDDILQVDAQRDPTKGRGPRPPHPPLTL